MPSWHAQKDFTFTDIEFYYYNRCSTVIRTSILFWHILGSNPCSENVFAGYGLMCSQDRGTGLYPKPTVSNLPLPMQFFLKTNLCASLSSTQTFSKKFIFSEQNITSIGNVHVCCVPRPSTPDFSLKTEYTIHLMLWFDAHLKNKGLSRYGSLWWHHFWKRIPQDSDSGVSCLRSLASKVYYFSNTTRCRFFCI